MIAKILKWRDLSEEPTNTKEPVLYCTANGKLGVFKSTVLCDGDDRSGWKRLVDKYNIKYWTYSKEITPLI